ncbi:MAG: hypothetical protein K0S71_41 [Clostridia bacterium]|jgi:hypothetical protein|nr:hypothetical protein [Clostridia bacterium]
MDNNKLREIKNRLDELPNLEIRFNVLTNRIEEAKEETNGLLRAFEKESLDVEKIKQNTLSAMVFKFIGKYEAKLTKEEEEELEAKLKYDKSIERVRRLEEDRCELSERIWALKKEQEMYQDELDARERKLENSLDTQAGTEYAELEKKRKGLVSQFTEIKEALTMGRRVIEAISTTITYLNKAQDWATYDVWSRGGILTHMMKYERLDEAQRNFSYLSSLLQDF